MPKNEKSALDVGYLFPQPTISINKRQDGFWAWAICVGPVVWDNGSSRGFVTACRQARKAYLAQIKKQTKRM